MELQQAKTSTMLSQIQPHFLYNILNTISYTEGSETKTTTQAITVNGAANSGSSNDTNTTTYPVSVPTNYSGRTKVIHNAEVPDYVIDGSWLDSD